MKGKLLGYTLKTEDRGRDSDGHDNGSDLYKFYIELPDLSIHEFIAEETWGPCGSGYCGASWGHIDNDIKINSTSQSKMYDVISFQPIKNIEIDIINNKVVMGVLESSSSYDAIVSSVKSLDGDVIVTSTGDGGCQYYSSGQVRINNELFKSIDEMRDFKINNILK